MSLTPRTPGISVTPPPSPVLHSLNCPGDFASIRSDITGIIYWNLHSQSWVLILFIRLHVELYSSSPGCGVLLSRELHIGTYICSFGFLSLSVTFWNLQSSPAVPGFFIQALRMGIYGSTPAFLHSHYLLKFTVAICMSSAVIPRIIRRKFL